MTIAGSSSQASNFLNFLNLTTLTIDINPFSQKYDRDSLSFAGKLITKIQFLF